MPNGNILGGVRTGLEAIQTFAGLEAREAATKLQKERFEFGKQQAEIANAAAREQQNREFERSQREEAERQRANLMGELARNEKLLQNPDVLQNVQLSDRLFNRNNVITTELFPGSVNLDPRKARENTKEWQADNKAMNLITAEFGENSPEALEFNRELQNKWQVFPERVEELRAPIEEERAFITAERRGGVTAVRRLQEKRAELDVATDIARTQRKEKAKEIRETLKGIPGLTEQQIEAISLNLPATALGKIIPPKERVEQPILRNRPTGEIDEITGAPKMALTRVFQDEEGNFVFQDIQEFKPPVVEQPAPVVPTVPPSGAEQAIERGRADGRREAVGRIAPAPPADIPEWLFKRQDLSLIPFYQKLLQANPGREITEEQFDDAVKRDKERKEKQERERIESLKTGRRLFLGEQPRGLTAEQQIEAARTKQRAIE
jgi:phage anti-repressor protein